MTSERYNTLSGPTPPRLTMAERRQGWHYCFDWDGMLVGPGMHEINGCTCEAHNKHRCEYPVGKTAKDQDLLCGRRGSHVTLSGIRLCPGHAHDLRAQARRLGLTPHLEIIRLKPRRVLMPLPRKKRRHWKKVTVPEPPPA